MTYESASEAEVLKTYWRNGRPLENTVFVILDPSGRPLTRTGRTPDWIFRDADDMANGMRTIASEFRTTSNPTQLPVVATVRLGTNVAACDKRPLAIVVAHNAAELSYLEHKLAPLAWSQQYMGKLVYTAGHPSDLSAIRGASGRSGFVFAAPNEFGTSASSMMELPAGATTADLERAISFAISSYTPNYVDHREHIRIGKTQGIEWQTAIPVTDPMAIRAQQTTPRGPGFGSQPGRGGMQGGY